MEIFDGHVFAWKSMPYHWRRYVAAPYITDDIEARAAGITAQDWGLTSEQILHQRATSHCVGFGDATWHNCLPIGIPPYYDEDGHKLYYEGVAIGGFPNSEEGSTTEWGAKALRARGLLKTFAFAASIEEMIIWILAKGSVLTGLMWTQNMARPDTNGIMHATGSVVGGHETCWTGYDRNTGLFKCANSWGTSFGKGGFAWLTADDMKKQLDLQGDCCLAVEIPTAPSPELEKEVLRMAATLELMPVNHDAALWKYAKAHNLEDTQSDEVQFSFQGKEYIMQAFNLGWVYAEQGDWANIRHIAK